jgi:hypothetical protein
MIKRSVFSATVFSALVAVSSLGGQGCFRSNVSQCKLDGDCRFLGTDFRCSAGVCAQGGPVSGDGGADPVVSCSTTPDCETSFPSRNAVCRDQVCLPLLGGAANVVEVTANYTKGDPIFVGVLMAKRINVPGNGLIESIYDSSNVDAVRLAVEQWDSASNGGISVGNATRPIVAVVCDTYGDSSTAQQCMSFMKNTLRAPVVITGRADDTKAILPQAVAAPQTLVLCTDCDALDFDTQQSQGMLWFGASSPSRLLPLTVEWSAKQEARIRALRSIPASTKVKVALISPTDNKYTRGDANRPGMFSKLMFNGATSAVGEQDGSVLNIATPAIPNYRQIAQQIAQAEVSLVIVEGLGAAFHQQVLPEIEASWPTGKPKPFYQTGQMEAFENRYNAAVGLNEDLRKRVTGEALFSPDELDANNAEFRSAFRRRYSRPANAVAGYETFSAAAFAITAAVNLQSVAVASLSGPDIVSGLKRLIGGPTVVNLKAADISRGISALKNREQVDLIGVQSELDWDPATGELKAESAIYCLKRETDERADGLMCFPPNIQPGSVCNGVQPAWKFDLTGKAVGEPNLAVCDF